MKWIFFKKIVKQIVILNAQKSILVDGHFENL